MTTLHEPPRTSAQQPGLADPTASSPVCSPVCSSGRGLLATLSSREVLSFLAVGGLGYVVDVAAFNLLLSVSPTSGWHPSVSRCLAVVAAMVVTYLGNRLVTWRGRSGPDRHREIVLFVVFNLIGLALSLGCLWLSHDLLGLTSRLADNLSANVVGLALGTGFRFWSYRRFVFA